MPPKYQRPDAGTPGRKENLMYSTATSIPPKTHNAQQWTTAEIISRARISDVARVHGLDPQRGRIPAPWRKTTDRNVFLSDSRNLYIDFADGGRRGGLLDFISRIRGCSAKEALAWLADFVGVPLAIEVHAATATDRQRWAEERRIRREAQYFSDAATVMTEWALEELPPADPERAMHTALSAALRASPEAEYRAWLERSPVWAEALVQAGRARAKRLQMLLANWLLAEVAHAN
jgi:hypothetical protein